MAPSAFVWLREADGADFIQLEDVAGGEGGRGFGIHDLFAFELNAPLLNQATRVAAGLGDLESLRVGRYHHADDIGREAIEFQLRKFGVFDVRSVETIDGWKYHFDREQWLMIRASGTEPVLRTYAESDSLENARKILKACKEAIGA